MSFDLKNMSSKHIESFDEKDCIAKFHGQVLIQICVLKILYNYNVVAKLLHTTNALQLNHSYVHQFDNMMVDYGVNHWY